MNVFILIISRHCKCKQQYCVIGITYLIMFYLLTLILVLYSVPGPPTLKINETTKNSITVTWTKPVEVNGMLTGYNLKWKGGQRTFDVDASNFTITNLDSNTMYSVNLKVCK